MYELTLYTDINLQLFDNTQTTLLNEVGNDLSPEMKIFHDTRLIDLAEPYLVHDQFGDKEDIPKNNGKSIEFRRFSSLDKAMTTLTEGVTPKGDKLDVTKLESTVSQYGNYIELSDVLELTAYDRMMENSLGVLGSQAGRTLDTVTREVITAGTNVMYAPKADGTEVLTRATVAADCLLTVPVIYKAAARLKAMNTRPIDGYFVAIVHPNVACDLMLSEGWLEAHKYAAPENIYEGEIGKIGQVRFVESTEAKIVGGAGADGVSVYCTMVIGANAYGVTSVRGGGLQTIVKQLGSGGSTDPLNQRATVGWKALKTAERLVEEYMIRIEHASATDPNADSN